MCPHLVSNVAETLTRFHGVTMQGARVRMAISFIGEIVLRPSEPDAGQVCRAAARVQLSSAYMVGRTTRQERLAARETMTLTALTQYLYASYRCAP